MDHTLGPNRLCVHSRADDARAVQALVQEMAELLANYCIIDQPWTQPIHGRM